jgi:hypothetical protein
VEMQLDMTLATAQLATWAQKFALLFTFLAFQREEVGIRETISEIKLLKCQSKTMERC